MFAVSWVLQTIHSSVREECCALDQPDQKRPPLCLDLREGEAFQHLKDALIRVPILQLANLSKEFIVTTDANDFAIGAVLSQVWDDGEHFVAYESKKMNVAEVNYATHERELLSRP